MGSVASVWRFGCSHRTFLIATAALAFASTQAYAQELPPRSVFRCKVAGKVVYSDALLVLALRRLRLAFVHLQR